MFFLRLISILTFKSPIKLFELGARLELILKFLALYPKPNTYSFPHDSVTKSIRVNYNASNSNIIPNINGKQSDLNSSDIGIFDNFFNIGDPDYFNQNFSINYSLPFNLIPFLNFIDGSYNYSGDFNWQRGSDMLNNISSETGEVLGRVNTIQNANTQNFSLSLNFDKIYRILFS